MVRIVRLVVGALLVLAAVLAAVAIDAGRTGLAILAFVLMIPLGLAYMAVHKIASSRLFRQVRTMEDQVQQRIRSQGPRGPRESKDEPIDVTWREK